mgnify:CR=1 FL=1
MGVMSCDRRECDNIMCDTYINSVGYVCYDCQKEFESFVSAKNKIRTENKLMKWLNEFMEKPKRQYQTVDEGITVEEFFRNYKAQY